VFIYLFALHVSDRYRWALKTSRISRSSTFKSLSNSYRESKASDPWPYLSYVLSFSSIHFGLHALILYLSLILQDLGSYLVSCAQPCSHECRTNLSILCDAKFGFCICKRLSPICRDVSWLWWGSMLWFEHRLERWRKLDYIWWCG
jgi:hypothetical protein